MGRSDQKRTSLGVRHKVKAITLKPIGIAEQGNESRNPQQASQLG